ncbi:hypothetical protein [Allomuricauda sp. NBRC 101325]|uniref:hypothetical protein n=1 Tax=Allomuricauda sp. NBRC 101325 TaxID=1113758 RepID=UPI0024A0DF7F|nr:hypothetical protein [Muricauda sp. NBRC 101325]GLU44849.1 hypothetical protein Musp01_24730 [Muricauda sp. NBRC 101325]
MKDGKRINLNSYKQVVLTMENFRKAEIIGVLVMLVLAFLYVRNEYTKYDRFFGEKFPDDFSFNLGRYVLSYENEFEIESFDNKDDLEKLNTWLQENFNFSDYESELIKYGFSIKEIPSKNLNLFCLNGPDGKPSSKYVSGIKGLELDKSELISEPSFIQFLFGNKDFDIALFAID